MNKFFCSPGNHSNLVKEALLKRGNWEELSVQSVNSALGAADFIWKPTNLSVRQYANLDEMKNFKRLVLNHFENNRVICTKTGLVRSLRYFYSNYENAKKEDYDTYHSMATSFLLTAGVEDKEYNEFITRFKDIHKGNVENEKVPAKHCIENFWLIKPANMNQGKGIEIFKSLREIMHFMGQKPLNTLWVAQKYIEKPLLYNGRKFDIRVWVLITEKQEKFGNSYGAHEPEDNVQNKFAFLKEQSAFKDKLIARVSPDFRTPLNGKISMIGIP